VNQDKVGKNMGSRAGQTLNQIADRLNPPTDRGYLQADKEWWQAVKEAHREWEEARVYFENVSDPDLVDHAVHLLAAAEKKYNYILNQMRQEMAEDGD